MKNTSITVYCGMLHLQYNIGNMNICRTLFQRFHFLKWAHLLWKRWKQMKKTIERIFTRKNNNEIWLLFNLRLFFNISLLSYISITYIYKFIRVSVFSLNFNLFIFLSLSLFWFYYGYFVFLNMSRKTVRFVSVTNAFNDGVRADSIADSVSSLVKSRNNHETCFINFQNSLRFEYTRNGVGMGYNCKRVLHLNWYTIRR